MRFPQGKLIVPLTGEIWDVVVDVRRGSPTFGKWLSISLTSEPCRQLYVPPGFAHGFAVMSEAATVLYKCTDFYHPEDECGILWDDPDLAIPWPVTTPLLSDKDREYPKFGDLPLEKLPILLIREKDSEKDGNKNCSKELPSGSPPAGAVQTFQIFFSLVGKSDFVLHKPCLCLKSCQLTYWPRLICAKPSSISARSI